MVDINPDAVTQPIVVDPAEWKDMVATGARDFGLVVSVLTAMLGLLKTHSWALLITYIQGDTFATAGGIVCSVGIFLWRQWNARRAKSNLVTVVKSAPNSVATLTTDPAPPAK